MVKNSSKYDYNYNHNYDNAPRYILKEDYYFFINLETTVLIEQLMNRFATEWGGYLIGSIDKENKNIMVEDIILPRQIVSNAECSFCPEDEIKVIDEYKTKYLGIIHSHNTLGSFHSPADITTVDGALMLSGDRFVSIVLSEVGVVKNRIFTHDTSDLLLNNLLSISFDGMYVRKVKKVNIKHQINQMVVWQYEKPSEELILKVTNKVNKFIEEIEEYKITVAKEMRTATLDEVEVMNILQTYYSLVSDIISMTDDELPFAKILINLASDSTQRVMLMSFLEDVEYFDRTSKSSGFTDYRKIMNKDEMKDLRHY